MLESHTRQIDTRDTTTIKRARKEIKKRPTDRRQNRNAALGRPAMKLMCVCVCVGGGGNIYETFAQPMLEQDILSLLLHTIFHFVLNSSLVCNRTFFYRLRLAKAQLRGKWS